MRGGVDPVELSFLPRFSKLWRYGVAIGSGMGPYPPRVKLAIYTSPNQSAIGRWGCDFHTMAGGINPGDIRFRSRVVGVVDVWMDSAPGMGSCRPRVALTLCTSPGQSTIRQRGNVFIFV